MCPTYSSMLAPGRYMIECRQCDWHMVTNSPDVAYNCRGLGWVVTEALKAIGVTEGRYGRLMGMFGMKCRCRERREWLNTKRRRR